MLLTKIFKESKMAWRSRRRSWVKVRTNLRRRRLRRKAFSLNSLEMVIQQMSGTSQKRRRKRRRRPLLELRSLTMHLEEETRQRKRRKKSLSQVQRSQVQNLQLQVQQSQSMMLVTMWESQHLNLEVQDLIQNQKWIPRVNLDQRLDIGVLELEAANLSQHHSRRSKQHRHRQHQLHNPSLCNRLDQQVLSRWWWRSKVE